jgi:DNA-binding transcriptional MerR regulator
VTPSRELVKLYYRIGEVANIVGVQPHVLRYWETEFRTIRPQKSHKGQRVYSRRDVEKLLRVKDLLKNQGFTIAGAKRKLREPEPSRPEPAAPVETAAESPVTFEVAPAPQRTAAPVPIAPIARPHAAERPRDAEYSAARVRHVLLTLREDIVAMLDGFDTAPRRPKLPTAPG